MYYTCLCVCECITYNFITSLYELSRISVPLTFGYAVEVTNNIIILNDELEKKTTILFVLIYYVLVSASCVNTMHPQYKMTAPGVFNCNIFGLYESNSMGFAVKNCPHNASLFWQSFLTMTTYSAATFDRFNAAKNVPTESFLIYITAMTRFLLFSNFFVLNINY